MNTFLPSPAQGSVFKVCKWVVLGETCRKERLSWHMEYPSPFVSVLPELWM
jgi:hypothetical protein